MTDVVIADASALQMMPNLTSKERSIELFRELTVRVESCVLCFPREVAHDLGITARDDSVAAWAAGLGRNLTPFRADIKHMRTLMSYVKSCGYDDGFDSISGEEPSIANVARLACQYAADGKDFVIASEDTGEGPLSPTMEQLCDVASWVRVSASDALDRLGLASFLS